MSSLVTCNFHENNLYTLFNKNVYALFLVCRKEKKSTLVLEWRSFPFSIADKTRASLVENLGLSIKSTSPSVACRFCIERMIEYPAPKGRASECARPTTINRWWRLSVTARSTRLFQFIFK